MCSWSIWGSGAASINLWIAVGSWGWYSVELMIPSDSGRLGCCSVSEPRVCEAVALWGGQILCGCHDTQWSRTF